MASQLKGLLHRHHSGLVGIAIRLVAIALVVLLNVVLARTLGPQSFGEYVFVFSIVQMLTLFSRGGLELLIVREVSASIERSDAGIARGVLIRAWQVSVAAGVIAAAVFAVIVFIIGERIGEMSVLEASLAGGAYVVFMALTGMLEAGTRGSGHVYLGQLAEHIARPATQVLALLVLFLFLSSDLGASHALFSAVMAAAVAITIAFGLNLRLTPIASGQPPSYPDRKWVADLMFLSLSAWVGAVNSYSSFVVLGLLSSDAETAMFQVAMQLTTLIALGLVSVNATLSPQVSRNLEAGRRGVVANLAVQGARLSLAFGAPLVAAYFIAGEAIISLLFGNAYVAAFLAVQIMSIAQLVNISCGPVGMILYNARQERLVFASVALSAAINLVLSLVLVPSMGAAGAALASAVSMVTWNAILVLILYRKTGIVCLPFRLSRPWPTDPEK